MARLDNNLVIHGLSGMLGKQLVIRRHRGTYVVSVMPPRVAGRKPTPQQKEQRERFRRAVLHGKAKQGLPEYQALAAASDRSAFNVAVADYLHPPEILGIDVSAYTGAAGQVIRIHAVDDVKVKAVGIRLAGDDDTLIEKGQAVASPQDPHLWTYTTAVDAPSSVNILVDATDLAGRVTEGSAHT